MTGGRKHIVLLSVSAGDGHRRAAAALAQTAEQLGHRTTHLDVMDLVPSLFRRVYCGTYLRLINRHPALWGYLYHTSDRARPDSTLSRLRRMVERLNTRAVVRRLASLAPDLIICTHFLPAQICSHLRTAGTISTPTWVVVTDFDVHALWAHEHLSGYCVADEEIAWRIRGRGIGDAQVAVTGIPIDRSFRTVPGRDECASELGLDPARTTALLMGGGSGIGAIDTLAQRLLEAGMPQVIAGAGRNEAMLTRLQVLARAHPGRLVAVPFTPHPERLMACADLLVGKPGGLTTAECLAVGLPLLVVSPIPGQEERNADYLLEHGAGLKAHDLAGLSFRTRMLLQDLPRLQRLAGNARHLGRPGAAAAVLDAACT